MKKKNGFTLVEIIAVVVILLVITLFATPKLRQLINNGNDKAKEIAKQRIINAAKDYATSYINNFSDSLVNDGDYNYIGIEDLLNSGLIDNEDIKEFNNLTGVKGTLISNDKIEYTLMYDSILSLIVELNGGTTNQVFQSAYLENASIQLMTPTKDKSNFLRWEVVSGTSTINDNILTLRSNTTIYALWQNYPRLTVDLEGGVNNQTYETQYESGTVIELTPPTKEGNTFTSWVVTSGNSIISGNTLTIGTEDTVVKAVYGTCPAGTYSENNTCIPCAIGSYSESGSTSCIPCQNGTTTSSTGQASCNATCSNNSNSNTWETVTWDNNTVTNNCSIATCTSGYYVENNVCKLTYAILLPGVDFNIKMKQLAGNDTTTNGASTVDTNIKSIVKSSTEPAAANKSSNNIVSTNDSIEPVYMWYSSNTIYYWSNASKIYLNSDSFDAFYRLEALTSVVDLSYFDSSNVTTMRSMFNTCKALTSLTGLENWDVSNVESMYGMFYRNDSLTSLTALSSWDVSSVTDMGAMFMCSQQITTLNGLQNWDVSNVTNLSRTFSCPFSTNIGGNSLTDISALRNWNVANVGKNYDNNENNGFAWTFNNNPNLSDTSAINNWYSNYYHTINDDGESIFHGMFNGCPTHPTFSRMSGTWGTYTDNSGGNSASGTFKPS